MNKKRWLEILKYLDRSKAITSEELALKTGLSSRTIRKEMKQLKDTIINHGGQLHSKTNAGYLLEITDEKQYQLFLSSLQEPQDIPETSQERIQYLLEFLLAKDQFVKVEDLCERIYVSRASLTSDLKTVRKLLEGFNLKLIARPGYGIRVEGKEFDLRLCIATNTIRRILNETDDQNETSLRKIAACIEAGLKDTNLKISDVAYQNLIVHIYIALKRIQENDHMPLDENQMQSIEKEYEFAIANKIVALLSEQFNIEIPYTEISYIAIHLASKRIIEESDYRSNVVIDDEINTMVTHMLDEIRNSYNISFHDDLELRMVLAMHLIPLTVRLKYDMNLKNPLLKEIQSRYTLAYMMADTACEFLRRTYQKQINEDEIAYFALHFNLAMERRKTDVRKKNLLVVCSTGRGSAQMLVYRMKQEFGKYIDHIDTCDVLEVKNIDFTKIDYVITTVPIPFSIPRPILNIQLFLEKEDISAIRSLLRQETVTSLSQYFSPDLFISNLNASNKEEVIAKMVDQIKKVKNIPDNFYDLVLEREKMAVTAFGNQVAIPHPNKAVTDETFVCVAVLHKPVLWDKHKVQFIFMMSLKKDSSDHLQRFSAITSKMLFSKSYIYEIIHQPAYETMMSILATIEQEMD